MSYRLVQTLHEKALPIQTVCRVVGISRAGYYQRCQRPQQQLTRPTDLTTAVKLRMAFAASGKSYGSRRLCRALQTSGVAIGRYRVRRLMREAALTPVWKRPFVATTDSQHDLPVAENLLNRRFNVATANQAWVSDITYIPTRQGWLYLAAVMDLYSRKIVGWATAPRMPTELVATALRRALHQRQPAAGLLIHSDRGSQYASQAYQTLLGEYQLQCSMSRTGNCWDNAVMERFFLSLKQERVWQNDYANHTEAQRDINDYIVGFYNTNQLHSTLGYLSPTAFEQKWIGIQPIKVSEIT